MADITPLSKLVFLVAKLDIFGRYIIMENQMKTLMYFNLCKCMLHALVTKIPRSFRAIDV